ncbi:hypothetical protein PoB_000673700 [Plakobranchus ocellatus]|uniref:Uncharacterized protein n=1 Tax=Plakobranchus ocellatus TaxID=259542 RepID=A0AAV3YCQ1_9GAST|nr:hypothetical protein PoB_000673700 [Plakobranchus ocellatus]
MDDKVSNFASRIEGKVSSLSHRIEKMEDRIDKLEKGRRSPSPKTRSTSPLACFGCEPRSEEQRDEDKYETGRASWGSRSCPAGHPKDSPPQEVLNPNGLDPPYQPQRVVNPNGFDPPRLLQKVVNPNGLDPPDQLKLKEKLDLVASEGITGMHWRKE